MTGSRSSAGSGNVLDGGTGRDTLVSGTGNDLMNGGADADTFVFAPANAADTAICTPGEDTIDLTAFAATDIHAFTDLVIDDRRHRQHHPLRRRQLHHRAGHGQPVGGRFPVRVSGQRRLQRPSW